MLFQPQSRARTKGRGGCGRKAILAAATCSYYVQLHVLTSRICYFPLFSAPQVVINYSHEKSLFMPDIDTTAMLFQPEPTKIPLVMMLHHQVDMILRHGMKHKGVRQ